ncbi:DNA helicase rad5 [Entophlyctis luteolus]|nr:DNA helicase rad5 [Entophlyctis luteolus]
MGFTDDPPAGSPSSTSTSTIKRSLSRSLSFAVQDELGPPDKPAPVQNLPNHLGRIRGFTAQCETNPSVDKNALNVPLRLTTQAPAKFSLEVPNSEDRIFWPAASFLPSANLYDLMQMSQCEFWATIAVKDATTYNIDVEVRWKDADLSSIRSPEVLADPFVQLFWAISSKPFVLVEWKPDFCQGDIDNMDRAILHNFMAGRLTGWKNDWFRQQCQDKLRELKIASTFDIIGVEQPESPFAVKLYDYQLRTLAWMQGIEDGEKSLFYAPNVVMLDNNEMFMDLETKELYMKDDNDEDQQQMLFDATLKSGIIADKPGVGKTIATLALCHTRPFLESKKKYLYHLHSTSTAFLSKATAIFVPNNIADQWVQEIRKCLGESVKVVQIKGKKQYCETSFLELLECDFAVITYQFLVNPAYRGRQISFDCRDFSPIIEQNKLKTSLAARKKFANNLKIDYCFNWIHFHRIVADESHEITEYRERAKLVQMIDMNADHTWLLTGTPRFESFHSIGPFAEMLGSNRMAWNHFQLESLRFIEQRVRRNEPEIQFPPPIYETIKVSQTVVEGAFYRSCLGSLSTEGLLKLCNHYQIGDAAASLGMHNVMGIESVTRLVQENRVAEIARLLKEIPKTSERLAESEEKLEDLIARGVEKDGKEQRTMKRRALEERIQELTENLTRDKERLALTQRQHAFFENFVNSYLSKAENKVECGVCLEEDVTGDIGIIPCGHLFCWDCASEVVRTQGMCPNCRDQVQPGEVMKVLSPSTLKSIEDELNQYKGDVADKGEATLDPGMVKTSSFRGTTHFSLQFGSKIRELVKYLRAEMAKSDDFRFVVFIQFSDLADLVSQALNTFGIATARFKGGWPQREGALKRFRAGLAPNAPSAGEGTSSSSNTEEKKQADTQGEVRFLDPQSKEKGKRKIELAEPARPRKTAKSQQIEAVKVLMLSARDSVSGLNLTEEHAVASEKQGVARLLRNGQTKTVKIVRFFVEGTIEAEMHQARVRAHTHPDGAPPNVP